MSARFIAHVERPDGRVHHIDCDAAHEDDSGRLALTVNTHVGAIASYAPGAWASYFLEAPPEPVTQEQVIAGEKSVNDYRRYLGMQPLVDDAPPAKPAPITVNVHVEGSVLSEKNLQEAILTQLSRAAAMRGIRW